MTTEAVSVKDVMEELKTIKKDVTYIKKHMVDADTILTAEEEKRLNEAIEEHKAGKTISLEDFEKNIGQ